MNTIAAMTTIDQAQLLPLVTAPLPIATACRALGISRATWYRYQSGQAQIHQVPVKSEQADPVAVKQEQADPVAVKQEQAERVGPRALSVGPRALSPDERQAVREVLYSERFVDDAPAEVYATLLDEGVYLCSIRTMYRLLKEKSSSGERRRQASHPTYARPELLATRPNELWSWDITKLRGEVKGSYFHLYVILDVFSRYVVGWMVAMRESAVLAEQLIAESAFKQGISTGQLTLHADRGSSMRSKPVALLLEDLGITKTHSRPHVSNDNPFSESAFKTLKYRPSFPARFASIEEARAFCVEFFGWYNQEHHHGGLALLTPSMVHHGQASSVIAARNATLAVAFALHPERFAKGLPVHARVPDAVWINPPVLALVLDSALPAVTDGKCSVSLEAKRV